MSSSAIIDRIRTLLDSIPPFDRLPADERESILADVSIEYYKSGEVILEQGSSGHRHLYVVESGVVRLMDVEMQRLIDKCGEGDVFGSFGLVKGGSAIYQAKAVEPTVCALLKGERFQQLYDRYEDFAAFFDNDAARYVRHLGREMDVTGSHLLFSKRLNQLVHRKLVRCSPDTSAQQAARIMRRERVDSILVTHEGKLAGIMTDGDLRNKLVARAQPVETAVRRLMTTPVVTVSSEASLFEAMMTMLNRQVTRLVITQRTDGAETPLGILTDRDVAHFRGQDPVATIQRIQHAPSVSELVNIRVATSEQLLRLHRQGVQPEMVHGIMSVMYDSLAVRVLELAEKELRARHAEVRVDLPWVWLRLGSGGRREMALNSRQHNALLYANPTSEEEAARTEQWFALLASRANEALASCGFTMSEFVARESRWRQSLRQWKRLYREWILQSDEHALDVAPIFFDLRGVYGEAKLVEELKRDVVDALNVQALDPDRGFLALMASNALRNKPPLSFLRRFILDRSGEHRHTFDIRERGIQPVVSAARVLALEIRCLDSLSTLERLRAAADAIPDMSRIVESSIEAYRFLVDFRLEDQLRSFEAGEPPKNRIDPMALPRVQQNLLRSAFATVAELQEAVKNRYVVARNR
jgi:CBS domain-containing protein